MIPSSDDPLPRQPREALLTVVRYAVVAGKAARLPEVYPRHRAFLEGFSRGGELLLIGTFDNPLVNGSQAIFTGREAAERFIAGDPFVVEGLAAPTVLDWPVLAYLDLTGRPHLTRRDEQSR